jgi:3-oxoacyl-[acyl-carrier protein] reductase
MSKKAVMVITGTSRGLGKYLAQYYSEKRYIVIGCSRGNIDFKLNNYQHFCLDVSDESAVNEMFSEIRKNYGRLDVLINNAGMASTNHILLTPITTIKDIINTNFIGTILFSRESAKLMKKNKFGRIINIVSVDTPLKLEGTAVYAASKAAIVNFTEILAKELSAYEITTNSVGPAPIRTDLIKGISEDKFTSMLEKQAIKRYCEFNDVSNVIDFFVQRQSDFVTGQVIYLGGV